VGRLQVADSVVAADDEVSADLVLAVVHGAIEVSGRVGAPWTGSCRRCLRPLRDRINVEVRELYRPRPPGELPDDEETYPLSADYIDLEPLVRDALLLALPLAPVCRTDCAGLCPICGADRNEGPCGCPATVPDNRWAALDLLREGPTGAS
jgi:uncharacterized protein